MLLRSLGATVQSGRDLAVAGNRDKPQLPAALGEMLHIE